MHPDSLTSAVATGPLPGTPPAVVDIRGLHVRFGSVDAVRGIDVSARAGEGTALLGRNGAGKSTTMRVLAGVVPPTEGVVLVAGLDVRRDLLERFDLGGVAHRVTGGFSHGMGRRMSVILAVFHQPKVVLLDEPFDGVDPLGVDATMDVIREQKLAGSAVLVSTHLRELAVQACQHAIVLRGGSAVAEMPAAEIGGERGAAVYRALLDDPEVRA